MSSKYSPKLSIIMQSFLKDYPGARSDPERKFIRAVYSVISQTNQNWELVIVSDGCSITEKLYNDYFREYDNILFEKVCLLNKTKKMIFQTNFVQTVLDFTNF